jgi:hypothetical protein
MPRLSVWFIRAALVYLALGFTIGGLLLFNKGVPIHPYLWQLLPAHIEFLMVGWIVQLVMGVSFWILPRFTRQPKRGNIRLAWLAFILVNLGVWISGMGPLLLQVPWASAAGRSAEAAAALAYLLHAWPRVKPFGK